MRQERNSAKRRASKPAAGKRAPQRAGKEAAKRAGKRTAKRAAGVDGRRTPVLLTPAVLRGWPLPQPEEGGSKEERGRALIVGGSPEMPGAAILAATGALRAGAGKVRVAAPARIAPFIATAVPEVRVFALPETKNGSLAPSAADLIAEQAAAASATLIGPGLIDEQAIARALKGALARFSRTALILDALALSCMNGDAATLRALKRERNADVLLTPHASEMAKLLGISEAEAQRDPLATARRAATEFAAVVALKGRETYIVAPDGQALLNRAGNVGLAISGSGDALAGIILGLAARGADVLQAAAWGVALHARAAERLAARMGTLGYLPRELLAEIPSLMIALAERK